MPMRLSPTLVAAALRNPLALGGARTLTEALTAAIEWPVALRVRRQEQEGYGVQRRQVSATISLALLKPPLCAVF